MNIILLWWYETVQYIVFTSWYGASCLSWFWRLKSKSMNVWSEFDPGWNFDASVFHLCPSALLRLCSSSLRLLLTRSGDGRGERQETQRHPRTQPSSSWAVPRATGAAPGLPSVPGQHESARTLDWFWFFWNALTEERSFGKKWSDQEAYRFKASCLQSGTSTASARVDMTRS